MQAQTSRRGRPTGETTLDAESIKQIARAQMAARGTAGISLRAIARALHVTAPALYNYFPRLEQLISALIVDAFTGLAAAMNEAADAALGAAPADDRYLPAIEAMGLAYRTWAVTHPTEFQLIYGNPIPGYEAPAEITVPLASLPFTRLTELFAAAWASGTLRIPAHYDVAPAAVRTFMAARLAVLQPGLPPELLCLIVSSWARLHGMVMLELFGHLAPVTGDPAAYYAYELHAWCDTLSA